ncbi:MAG: hypothetical protein AAGD09_20475 [Cyanobacteria bacterium P01_F01_bin.56]
MPHEYYQTLEKGHGRIERRRHWLLESVEHTVAIAHRLRQDPLQVNFKTVDEEGQAIAEAVEVENGTLLTPKPITTAATADQSSLPCRQVSRRI